MNSYDNRLFRKGIRKHIHTQRFRWMADKINNLNTLNIENNLSIFELGCFNCRSLSYLDFKPLSYYGVDAGWEGGIDEAISKFPEYQIIKSENPDDIKGIWDIGLALETLEHLSRPEILEQYIQKLALHCKILVATVPNEIGPLFAAKQLYKILIMKSKPQHTMAEFILQSLGFCQFVEQDNHRGFDYRHLKEQLQVHFEIKLMKGINHRLPNFMNTQIGFVAYSKHLV